MWCEIRTGEENKAAAKVAKGAPEDSEPKAKGYQDKKRVKKERRENGRTKKTD